MRNNCLKFFPYSLLRKKFIHIISQIFFWIIFPNCRKFELHMTEKRIPIIILKHLMWFIYKTEPNWHNLNLYLHLIIHVGMKRLKIPGISNLFWKRISFYVQSKPCFIFQVQSKNIRNWNGQWTPWLWWIFWMYPLQRYYD